MKTQIVTSLKRNATRIIDELNEDKKPVLITQRGIPAAFLVDVDSFEGMQKKIKILEGIARGEKAIQEGRILTSKQARRKLGRWLK